MDEKLIDQTLLSIMKADTKLIFIEIRKNIVKLLCYINSLRSIQKSIALTINMLKEKNFLDLSDK